MLHPSRDGVALDIHAQPNAKSAGIVGRHGGRLKVALRAAPQDGQANRELIELLAQVFGIAKSAITLTRGASSRQKTVDIEGVSEQQLRSRLEELLDAE